MLSIKDLSSSNEAGKYYAKADYYTKGEDNVDIHSNWLGKGAALLGLEGSVDPETFKSILEGNLPNGQQLGRMLGGKFVHKPGWDLTFSAPKSVSILALIGGDNDLMQAHHIAVREALEYMESNVLRSQTTTDEGRAYYDIPNAVVAQFTHTTNRTQDPQLHTHNVVMNAGSVDGSDWRSIYSRDIYHQKMLLGLVYRSKLAELTKELGYTPVWDKESGTFELNEIRQDHIDEFSQRRSEIKSYAEEHDLNTAEEMAEAATRTRASKKNIPTQEIINSWDNRARELGVNFEALVEDTNKKRNDPELHPKQPLGSSDQAVISENEDNVSTASTESVSSKGGAYEQVKMARDILAHYDQAFSAEALLQASLKFAGGSFSLKQVVAAQEQLVKENVLIPSMVEKGMFTTPEAINRELNILDNIERGKGKYESFANSTQIASIEDAMNFTKSQSKSFNDIANTKDKFMALQGFAGTGKTYLTRPISTLAQANGYEVIGMAPNGSQAETLGNELGIASQTVKSFLVQAERDKLNLTGKQLWVVDETTLLNGRDTEALVKLATENKNTRVLFIGDKKQLSSIEAGRVFSTMLKGGISYTTNNDIIRQHDQDYLGAVQAFTRGQIREAFSKLEPYIHEHESAQDRFKYFVSEYMEHFDRTGKLPMAVVPNKQGEYKLSEMIRAEMRDRGVITGEDKKLNALVPSKVDGPQKMHSQFYSPGMVVKFNKRFENLPMARGDYLTIVKVEGDDLVLSPRNQIDDKEKHIRFNPSLYSMKESDLTAYKEVPINIAVGDNIVWKSKNNRENLLNGSTGQIKEIKQSVMTVDFGKRGIREVDLEHDDNKQFQHNYTQTAFNAQGATDDKNMLMAESWRRNLVTQPSFYVGISRGKLELSVYTDNRSELEAGVIQRNGKNTEGVEHLTKYQAMQLRTPELQHRSFLDAIGLGDKDKFRTYEHDKVFHEPVKNSHEDHKTTLNKPQHEKSR
ncbi:MobF family relaxase [Thalassotalea marina]|uniref:Conjugative relaxase n=1 Tax=Thalassotalea marina TaxID=1673741 RepID=A0A919BRA2_9GAMM|nr:MobF family relaxase [Thalassotalea marina]GHG07144.1 conjugative relaxase [Thalassotalea marina]